MSIHQSVHIYITHLVFHESLHKLSIWFITLAWIVCRYSLERIQCGRYRSLLSDQIVQVGNNVSWANDCKILTISSYNFYIFKVINWMIKRKHSIIIKYIHVLEMSGFTGKFQKKMINTLKCGHHWQKYGFTWTFAILIHNMYLWIENSQSVILPINQSISQSF